jgi:hypothetical protein
MRKIRMFGLLAVSAMALAAFVGSSPASAAEFTSGGAESLGETTNENHVFALTNGAAECENTELTGSTSAASSTELLLNPTFTECEMFGFANGDVIENGCDFTLKAETTGSPGYATLNLHGCSDKTKGIQLLVEVPFFATCLVDIPEQSIPAAVRYSEPTGSSVRAQIIGSKIMADVTISTGFCTTILETGTHVGDIGAIYTGISTFTTSKGLQHDP